MQPNGYEARSLFLALLRERRFLFRRIKNDHGDQPRRLGGAGVLADPMVGAGVLEPLLASLVNADGLVVDLAPDLTGDDVGVDERRAGVTVRGRVPARGVVHGVDEQALARNVRDRLIREPRDGFA